MQIHSCTRDISEGTGEVLFDGLTCEFWFQHHRVSGEVLAQPLAVYLDGVKIDPMNWCTYLNPDILETVLVKYISQNIHNIQ